jgi:hypothetical protein
MLVPVSPIKHAYHSALSKTVIDNYVGVTNVARQC